MADRFLEESQLGALARLCREQAGKSRADVARELGVARPTIFYAEEEPQRGLQKLRKQMIEKYSALKVTGPLYKIEEKS